MDCKQQSPTINKKIELQVKMLPKVFACHGTACQDYDHASSCFDLALLIANRPTPSWDLLEEILDKFGKTPQTL